MSKQWRTVKNDEFLVPYGAMGTKDGVITSFNGIKVKWDERQRCWLTQHVAPRRCSDCQEIGYGCDCDRQREEAEWFFDEGFGDR